MLADIKLILAELTSLRQSIRKCIDKNLSFQQFDEHILPKSVMVPCFEVKFRLPVSLKEENDVVSRIFSRESRNVIFYFLLFHHFEGHTLPANFWLCDSFEVCF